MQMPHKMHAIEIREPGGPDVLQLANVAVPGLSARQVLIRVSAAGVNRPDCLQRQGHYPMPPDANPLPGLEIAGTVVACGPAATRWNAGDKLMALTHGGGYAEYCAVDERHCIAMPENLSFVEAAAVPETFFTVWYNVFMRAQLTKGETFLVHGGSSGIGTTAIQLARTLGCTVVTTAGSDDKCRFCEQLGADKAINYKTQDWPAVVREFTKQRGVDVLLDMVAGPYVQKNIDCMAENGRYSIIGFLQGDKAEVYLRGVLARRISLTGSTLRPRSVQEKAEIAEQLTAHVLPLLESGQVRPVIYTSFPLADAADAHRLMETSGHMGKIVLTVKG